MRLGRQDTHSDVFLSRAFSLSLFFIFFYFLFPVPRPLDPSRNDTRWTSRILTEARFSRPDVFLPLFTCDESHRWLDSDAQSQGLRWKFPVQNIATRWNSRICISRIISCHGLVSLMPQHFSNCSENCSDYRPIISRFILWKITIWNQKEIMMESRYTYVIYFPSILPVR